VFFVYKLYILVHTSLDLKFKIY